MCNDAFLSIQDKNTLITEKHRVPERPGDARLLPAGLDASCEAGGWIFVTEGSATLPVRPATARTRWLHAAEEQRPEHRATVRPAIERVADHLRDRRATSYASFRRSARTSSGTRSARSAARSISPRRTAPLHVLPRHQGAAGQRRLANYSPTNVFDTPFMQSVWGSGKITIPDGAHGATYDFSNHTNPVKTVH